MDDIKKKHVARASGMPDTPCDMEVKKKLTDDSGTVLDKKKNLLPNIKDFQPFDFLPSFISSYNRYFYYLRCRLHAKTF
jgi:hypothetical protein